VKQSFTGRISNSGELKLNLLPYLPWGCVDFVLRYGGVEFVVVLLVMISFASQAERCCPFQLYTALDHQQTVSEEAVDFHLGTSIAYRQSELQPSLKPSQDCQDLHLREYTHLDPSSIGQVAENVRTV
jgi:hypothetical protein